MSRQVGHTVGGMQRVAGRAWTRLTEASSEARYEAVLALLRTCLLLTSALVLLVSHDALDGLVAPVVRGVHSTSPAEVQVEQVAPGLRALMLSAGSLAAAVRARRAKAPAGSLVASLRGGLFRLVDALVQSARTYIYTTAMPPALAAAARAAIDIARFEGWRRDRLARLIAHFRAGATAHGFALMDSRTPIQPLIVGTSDRALAIAAKLEADGFYVPAIRSPTVPDGKARLRITLTALHCESDVERLVAALAKAVV